MIKQFEEVREWKKISDIGGDDDTDMQTRGGI